MMVVIVILFIISIALIGISFFQRDNVKEIEQELDHLQLSAMQEIYKLKKKMRVLEEELLQNDDFTDENDTDVSETSVNRIITKYKQGMSVEAIALSENLTVKQIRSIVKQNERVLT
ncbi:hypothetical protein [Metabacillus fastidiosus]|uniref:hypothetical protein n=1 Tax=Metabacillus fastidiosus TaxID=1458 RepID=UPI002DBB7C29|nr:hypothetical protein [Metabacillus fastidiosus]MEC2076561.1 hypothetical protein [Metabacillus fastidiosus]MED4530717.1 hypothetical protein [Metabacillus fastidiosus]